MNWLLLYEIVYALIVILVCLRIIYDTRSNIKTLAYLLLVIFLPVAGIFFYFSVGINYRKRKMYSKKLIQDDDMARKLKDEILQHFRQTLKEGNPSVQYNKELAFMLVKDSMSPLTSNNSLKLLVNGENKFPEVLKALDEARDHIHIEYYIFEDDRIGREIEKKLIQKAREGVTVRFIYDDFGSRTIRKKMVSRLKAAGVKAFPFHRVIFIALPTGLTTATTGKLLWLTDALHL